MLSPISFVLSSWEQDTLLQFPQNEQPRFMRIFKQIFEPRITFVSTFGRNEVAEVTRVEVTEDNLFLEMSWSEFYKISNIYKKNKIFPTWKHWKLWNERMYVERILQEKRDIYEDRFRLFRNQSEYLKGLSEIHKRLYKTKYGVEKLKGILKEEIKAIVCKVKSIENIRRNWAALKIQKAFRGLKCMSCGDKFYYGIGPFCSRECIEFYD